MRKQTLVNLLLLLLVALLGLLVWYSPDKKGRAPAAPLTQLDPASIRQITISNRNGPRFVMQRNQQGWWMSEPYRVRANAPRIDSLLNLLSTPQIETFAAPTGRLDEFGLAQPLAELTFNQTRISFGGIHPYNYHRYLRIDDQIYLIKDIFPHHALARAEEFVSHALFAEEAIIDEIRTPTWRLYQRQGTWALEPESLETDPGQLAEKVAAWQHSRAAGVLKAPATPIQQQVAIRLAGSRETVELGVIQQPSRTLLVNRTLGLAYRLNDSRLLQSPGSGH